MKENIMTRSPEGYTAVTPWVISRSSAQLIEFLVAVFDAEEVVNSRIVNERGAIIHVVVRIGDAAVLLFDAREGWGPTPAFTNVYVADVADTCARAVARGGRLVTEITQLWFGEKVARVLDPFGNLWWINERVEAVDFTDPMEVSRRASMPEAMAGIVYIQQSLHEAMMMQKEMLGERSLTDVSTSLISEK